MSVPSEAPKNPGWYQDPAGRYEYRWWDGSSWTVNVSRGGQQMTDPQGTPPPPPPPPPPGHSAKTPAISLVEGYLDRYGWHAHQSMDEAGEKEGLVLTGWQSQTGGRFVLAIDPQVERQAIAFRTVGVAHAPRDGTPGNRLNELFYALAVINYARIIGAWGYSPSSGELIYHAALPFFGKMEYDTFSRMLDLITNAVSLEAALLQGIIDGTSTANQVLEKEGIH